MESNCGDIALGRPVANGHAHWPSSNGLDYVNGLPNGYHQTDGIEREDHMKLEAVAKPVKKDRTAFGLALYALSSCFLATMLMFAKKLGEEGEFKTDRASCCFVNSAKQF